MKHCDVNDVMQTTVPHIFAVGDINGEGAFTHTSVNDGEICWDFYSGDDDRALSERISTYALFTDPPLGRVGRKAVLTHPTVAELMPWMLDDLKDMEDA